MEKTKNLSTAEYFLVIQKEYLIAEFRKRIYYSPNDKVYYQRVMNYKADKINDIAKRNRLDSILNNEEKLKEIRETLFDDFGKPKFEMSNSDIQNYYAIGNDFSYMGDIWVLDQINSDDSLVLYSRKKEKFMTVSKDDVSRIL